jgi:Bifunctional DNA primase/polymerase, N-terminal
VSVHLACWLLRLRKRRLERLIVGRPDYELRHSRELDRIIATRGVDVTSDAEMTVEAVRARGWQCVRLDPRKKSPPLGRRWQVTKNADEVASWFAAGANVGLVCHQRIGIAVLDPDELLPWADMIDTLGQPCLPWVITGSGRLHYYVRWAGDLPAKLTWSGTAIGEIQRGPGQQQVVLPGSIHPSGGVYRWIRERLGFLCEPINPVSDPLPGLLAYLRSYVPA